MQIILASASPRRRELMAMLTDSFQVCPAQGPEQVPPRLPAAQHARYLAVQKAREVFSRYPESLVIGADTIVLQGNVIFGKPRDDREARRMLQTLSGQVHQVKTGVCLKAPGWEASFTQTTQVEFYSLSSREIDVYIRSGEPFDKAGGYGIQGRAGVFVKGIVGDYCNVVGFPVGEIRRILLQKGICL